MATYAVSDLHGMYPLWEQIKNFLKPDDTLFVLGDCADRGPDGWKMIKEIYEHPQTIYLMGNHEDMLLDTIRKYNKYGNTRTQEYRLLKNNGGAITFENWLEEPEEYRQMWYEKLRELPITAEYVNINKITVKMSHAGFTPNRFNSRESLIWSRSHFNDYFDVDNMVIVHGHTPVEFIDDEFNEGALWYADNQKVDIDNAAFHYGRCVVLDLDTFDEHIFKIENFKR